MPTTNYKKLIKEVRGCSICMPHLPMGPNPVFRIHPKARILVAGQAPGIRVHETGIPFNDPSGVRLREWMGIDEDTFYDPEMPNMHISTYSLAETFDVGMDTGTQVTKLYQDPYPFKGDLDKVVITLTD